MGRHESLRLFHRLVSSHTPLPDSCRLMGLLGPIILILFGAVDHFGHHFSMCNWITAQSVRHDLPGLTAVTSQQPFEEALCSDAIPLGLEKYVNHFAILIHRPP